VADKGMTVVFEVAGVSGYDPATGTGTKTGKVRHSLKVTPPETFSLRYVDGESIRMGDANIILPAEDLEFDPTVGQLVEVLGIDWIIVSVLPLMTGEQIGAYQLQIRR
jgi:hypothetical protein